MEKTVASKVLQGIIWLGFAVILFSPLYVSSSLFFPFIVTKTVVFMITVEIIFFVFLILAWVDPKYKLRFNLVLLLMLIYIGILTLASLLGSDFFKSFWSNNERSDGILLLIHLFLFVFVLTSFLRKVKEWLYFFDIFLLASLAVSIVALDQYLALTLSGWKDHFLPSSNGARLAATIGNAGYVGGYMVFGVFIGLFMFFRRKNLWLKLAYGILVILQLFIALQTYTRGAWIAIGLLGGIFVLYLALFYFSDLKYKYLNGKILKTVALVLIVITIASMGFIYANKSKDFVQKSPVLSRLTSISSTDGTANNRIVTWGFAWQGIKEKPILGYGQENFYQVFDKYYTTENTEEWFDRSHNMVFDRAVTGGFLGLISYFLLLLLPFYFLWKFYKNSEKDSEDKEVQKSFGKKYFLPVIFTILILAYIIQNLFIFEALVTYIPLMFVLAFVGMYGPSYEFKFLENKKFKFYAIILVAIFIIPSLYIFNLKPLYANEDFIKIMSSQNSSFKQKMAAYEEVFSRNTLGNQEYRRYYFNFYLSNLPQWFNNESYKKQISVEEMAGITNNVVYQLNNQLEENDKAVTNHLVAMSVYLMASSFDSSKLDNAIDSFEQAKKLSPGRPQVYYGGADLYMNLAHYYAYLDKTDKAEEARKTAADLIYEGSVKNTNLEKQVMEFAYVLGGISSELKKSILTHGFKGKSSDVIFVEFKDKINNSSLDESVKSGLIESLVESFDLLKKSS